MAALRKEMLESLPAARDGIASGSAPSASLCSVSVTPAVERAATPDPVSSIQALASCGFAEMEHGMEKETIYAASCFDVGDPVRLCYLNAVGLNRKCGVIVEPINNAGRYGVKLLCDRAPKSVLNKNLNTYHTHSEDICHVRNDRFNLNAFPPCSCGFTTASRADDSNDPVAALSCASFTSSRSERARL